VADKEIKMAVDLIKDMSAKWEPHKYHNEYRESLQKWLDQQIEKIGKTGKKRRPVGVSNESVVDFISLLKDSMAKNKKQVKTKVISK
jgi:DNA end-binding protein Ku